MLCWHHLHSVIIILACWVKSCCGHDWLAVHCRDWVTHTIIVIDLIYRILLSQNRNPPWVPLKHKYSWAGKWHTASVGLMFPVREISISLSFTVSVGKISYVLFVCLCWPPVDNLTKCEQGQILGSPNIWCYSLRSKVHGTFTFSAFFLWLLSTAEWSGIFGYSRVGPLLLLLTMSSFKNDITCMNQSQV